MTDLHLRLTELDCLRLDYLSTVCPYRSRSDIFRCLLSIYTREVLILEHEERRTYTRLGYDSISRISSSRLEGSADRSSLNLDPQPPP